MDFIPGKSFEQLLKEGYKFSREQVLKYMRQLCEAMAYLHEQNPPIMHGDIKPANIMLTPEQRESVLALKNKMMNQNGNPVDDETIVAQQLDSSEAEAELYK